MAFLNAARTVVARIFRLVTSSGQVVAELEPMDPAYGIGTGDGSQLQMMHLDATVTDSAIAWTQNNPDGSGQGILFAGPTNGAIGTNPPPSVYMERDAVFPPDSRLRMSSGQLVGSDRQSTIELTSESTAGVPNRTSIVMQSTDPAAGHIARVVTLKSNATLAARVESIGPTGSATIECNDDDVWLMPGVTGGVGRLRLGLTGRNAYLPLGGGTQAIPTTNSVGLGGVVVTANAFAVETGDFITVTFDVRFDKIAGAADVATWNVRYQLNGGGFTTFTDRIIIGGAPIGIGYQGNHSHTWVIPAVGSGTLNIQGLLFNTGAAGNWQCVAPDSSAIFQQYGQR